jgi:cell division septation protein DedD
MEQFDIPHQRVKEKSVYLLHLDAARIILVSAAVIGIVIVSFLLGMNFIKGGDGAKTLLTKNDIFDGQKELDLLKTNIPGGPEEDELSKPMDDKLANSDKEEKEGGVKADPDSIGAEKHAGDETSAINKNESSDTLTGDNVSEIAAREKTVVKKPARKMDLAKKTSRAADIDLTDKHIKKATVRSDVKKRKGGKSKVVAVSVNGSEYNKVNQAGGFTIQVASLDTKTRAITEVKSLKDMNYDAYLDQTQVNGKQFFRVRIGPIVSKKKALDLLKDVQENERYRESYMVHE